MLSLTLAGAGLAQTGQFHPKGKPPSEHTLEVLEQERAKLPFADKRDFEEEKKGFIAAPESWKIMGNAGNVVWDMERYKFFLEGKDFASIHPSLQRQPTLNMNYGLYEAIPRIYQGRGFDLANISFVNGKTGIIGQLASTLVVFDSRFEIMPGTKGPSPEEDLNPYEMGPLEPSGG
jgi:alkyl sulfatase BDS1-like metallo-beta-lactamase superfamily hydrolase